MHLGAKLEQHVIKLMVLVLAYKMLQVKNVMNVPLDFMIFQIAKVDIFINFFALSLAIFSTFQIVNVEMGKITQRMSNVMKMENVIVGQTLKETNVLNAMKAITENCAWIVIQNIK